MRTTTELLCDSIKSYLTSSSINLCLPNEQLQALFTLANKHDVAHLIGVVLERENISDKEKYHDFFQRELQALFRGEQQNFERKRIYNCLEKAGLDYLPLKGSVIQDMYAEPWHRTSCDIDILVHDNELEKAVYALTTDLGYTNHGKSEHDISLFAPNGVHLELHYDFHEEEIFVKDVWALSQAINGSHHYVMPSELFLFCHIAHMAKHFKYAGCGFRPFIDLWIMEKRMPYDKDALRNMLAHAKLTAFADACYSLMALWFEDGTITPLLSTMSDYILDAGAYGSIKNRVAIAQPEHAGKLRYFLSRAFIPIDLLKYKYPILEKHPYLYIFCQIQRWYHLMIGNYDGVKTELMTNSRIDATYKHNIQTLMKELDL